MGDTIVTSRNVVKLFFSTLLIGGIVTGITGFIVRWQEFGSYFLNIELSKNSLNILLAILCRINF